MERAFREIVVVNQQSPGGRAVCVWREACRQLRTQVRRWGWRVLPVLSLSGLDWSGLGLGRLGWRGLGWQDLDWQDPAT